MSEPSMEAREAAWRRLREAGEQARRHGRVAEAEQHFLDALEEAERFGPADPRLAESLVQLAGLYCGPGFQTHDGQAQAEPLLRRALAIREQTLGPDHPDVAHCLVLLAQCCAGMRPPFGRPGAPQPDFATAEPLLRRALAIQEQAATPDPGLLQSTVHQLEQLYEQQGRDAEAEALLWHDAAIWERQAGPAHPFALEARTRLGQLYQKQGRLAEAEAILLQAFEVQEQTIPAGQPCSLSVVQALASFYWSQRRYAEAEPFLRRQLEIMERPSPNPPIRVHGLLALAENCTAQRKYEEAEQFLQRALALPELAEERARNGHQMAQVRQLYGTLLKLTGRVDEALATEAQAGPVFHGRPDNLSAIRRQLVLPPPAAEEQPSFVWISALIVGYVRENSAAVRWLTTGEATTWHCHRGPGGGGGSGGGGGQGQRDHALPLQWQSSGSWVDLEVFAVAAGKGDVVTTCFLPAVPPAPNGVPWIEVETRVRLLGRPSFAEAEVRLANAGDGDALRVCLDPPVLPEGWELLSQRAGAEPLPEPLEIGRIGAGGTGILVLRLCRRRGDGPPAVTIRGRFTDAGGSLFVF